MNPEYLGDSVYARFDGYHIWLYLDNGMGPKNEIALEPPVLRALEEYRKRVYQTAPSQQPPGMEP